MEARMIDVRVLKKDKRDFVSVSICLRSQSMI